MIFAKDLEQILAPFERMKADLATFITRMESVSVTKYAKAQMLKLEADAHMVNRDTAKRVIKNIENLL